jgi:hypothetical protein
VVAGFATDVRGGDFGWRQPLGLLCGVAVVVGAVPGVIALQTGRWDMPSTTMLDLLGQLPDHPAEGDYRVLWVGDQRLLPAAGQAYGPGVAYAVTDGRLLEVDQTWGTPPRGGDDEIAGALQSIATGTTTRAGRLLAPFAVRYIIVPVVDGAVSTDDEPLPLPSGLIDSLGDQLDLAEAYSPPAFMVYENRAWLPLRSVLTADGAAASRSAGAESLAQADVTGATPIMVGADHLGAASVGVPAGTVHLGVPFDRNWTVSVDGAAVEARPAFGSTMAFDIGAGGTATMEYGTSAMRRLLVLAQSLVWLLVLAVAAGARLPRARTGPRSVAALPVGPVLTFDPLPAVPVEPVEAGSDES